VTYTDGLSRLLAGLAQFAPDRENTTSASSNCVVTIGQLDGHFLTITLIWPLRKRIPFVDVMEGGGTAKGSVEERAWMAGG